MSEYYKDKMKWFECNTAGLEANATFHKGMIDAIPEECYAEIERLSIKSGDHSLLNDCYVVSFNRFGKIRRFSNFYNSKVISIKYEFRYGTYMKSIGTRWRTDNLPQVNVHNENGPAEFIYHDYHHGLYDYAFCLDNRRISFDGWIDQVGNRIAMLWTYGGIVKHKDFQVYDIT